MTCTSPSSFPRPVAPTALLAASLVALCVAFGAPAGAETPVTPLRPEAGTFIGALDSISASIVTLVSVSNEDETLPPGARRKRLIGTGVASTNRRIITTASLARPNGGTVQVLLGPGVQRVASLKGVDRRSNIAVFEIDDPLLRPLHRAPPQSMAVGSWVAVLSNVSVTRPQAALGRVVGRGERVDYTYSGDVLEIDAPTYPGTTGGAVVNEDGEWIATVVFRASTDSEEGGSVRGSAGAMPEPNSLLIALPVDQVDRIAEDLAAYGTVRHGFLGIRLKLGAPAPEDTLGVLVDGVIPGSPAAASGIRRGDRILALEGQEMRSSAQVTLFVQAARPGDELELTVLREGEILPVRVLLGSSTDAPRDNERAERKRQMMKLREELSRNKAEAEALERRLRELESGNNR